MERKRIENEEKKKDVGLCTQIRIEGRGVEASWRRYGKVVLIQPFSLAICRSALAHFDLT